MTIPLKTDSKPGIDPEQVLIAMRDFIQSGQSFNLTNNNCSVAVSKVISGGCNEVGAPIISGREYSGVTNPQVVINNAADYL